MEVEKKKKKRVLTGEEEEEERLKKLKGEVAAGGSVSRGGGGGEAVEVPTEEEVEEFFAILRRMKVAVKYFDDKGKGGKEWREALEQAQVTGDDGENADDDDGGEIRGVAKKNKKKGREVIMNVSLDLNAVAPEAAENDGAYI